MVELSELPTCTRKVLKGPDPKHNIKIALMTLAIVYSMNSSNVLIQCTDPMMAGQMLPGSQQADHKSNTHSLLFAPEQLICILLLNMEVPSWLRT